MKGSPYPKRKVTYGTDDAGNTVKTVTRGKGSDTASRTVTYSKETGKKLSKHRDEDFSQVKLQTRTKDGLSTTLGGEKTVDFSKGRGLGKTMVTRNVDVYNPDPTKKGVDFIESKFFPSGTKTVTNTRGQMIKRGIKGTVKATVGSALAIPALGADAAKYTLKNPKEVARGVVGGTAAVTGAVPYVGMLLAQHGLQKIQGGIEKVGKKIGSKVKNVATKVRKKRLAKKTK